MHRVSFQPSGRSVDVPAGTSLLEAVRRAGLPIGTACGAEGVCARCGVRVLRGGPGMRPPSEGEQRLKRRNRLDDALRLACRVEVRGPVEITATYW